jgi:6-phospho-beta-glucosidase
MARIKLAYVGGGSTRAPGTMDSFTDQGDNFQGPEIVLIDLDETRLDIVKAWRRKTKRCSPAWKPSLPPQSMFET